jgi:trk system potassium uptake protein TrkA
MEKRQYAVIGMGRFGTSVAMTLVNAGQEVLVVDSDEERIQKVAEFFTHAVVLDTTEEASLAAVGIRNFDMVVVAIGHDVQASVLTTLLLKEMGVKHIVAKAANVLHGKMLDKVGADQVVFPERDMGQRIAHNLMSTNIIDYFEVAPDLGIIEVDVKGDLVGKSLFESNLREKYSITVIAIRRNGKISLSPSPGEKLMESDRLILVGDNIGIQRFEAEVS